MFISAVVFTHFLYNEGVEVQGKKAIVLGRSKIVVSFVYDDVNIVVQTF
jgi:5,10-methylene-tetrahydrofolate dehydrogenase/methenyl tetrahydrofolate cyclohydrolase